MKKIIKKEVSFCDNCQHECSYMPKCAVCGVEYCYDCKKNRMVKYNAGVYFSGHGDIYYCNKCHDALMKGNDPVFHAYRKIESLRQESKIWGEDFRKRCNNAEKHLKKLAGL